MIATANNRTIERSNRLFDCSIVRWFDFSLPRVRPHIQTIIRTRMYGTNIFISFRVVLGVVNEFIGLCSAISRGGPGAFAPARPRSDRDLCSVAGHDPDTPCTTQASQTSAMPMLLQVGVSVSMPITCCFESCRVCRVSVFALYAQALKS
jgi:hypothetical protein